MAQDYTAFTLRAHEGFHFSEIKTWVAAFMSSEQRKMCGIPDSEIKEIRVLALWDTGASSSGITQRAAEELGLACWRQAEISTASGVVDAVNVYKTDLRIFDKADPSSEKGIYIPNLPVIHLPNNGAFDIIIGMDVLSIGDFSITNANNTTVVSLRIPPDVFHIDYLKMLQKNKAGKASKNNLKRFQTR